MINYYSTWLFNLLRFDVHCTNGDQKVKPRDNIARVLNKLIKILDWTSLLELIEQEDLKMPKLLGDVDV